MSNDHRTIEQGVPLVTADYECGCSAFGSFVPDKCSAHGRPKVVQEHRTSNPLCFDLREKLCGVGLTDELYGIALRAADEIERLTAELAATKQALDMGARVENEVCEENDRLRAALCMMYDKWENGDGCSDDGGVFLGNAFRLTEAEEDQVLALIPSERTADETSAARRPNRCTCPPDYPASLGHIADCPKATS